jgi:hypothetical protein
VSNLSLTAAGMEVKYMRIPRSPVLAAESCKLSKTRSIKLAAPICNLKGSSEGAASYAGVLS